MNNEEIRVDDPVLTAIMTDALEMCEKLVKVIFSFIESERAGLFMASERYGGKCRLMPGEMIDRVFVALKDATKVPCYNNGGSIQGYYQGDRVSVSKEYTRRMIAKGIAYGLVKECVYEDTLEHKGVYLLDNDD